MKNVKEKDQRGKRGGKSRSKWILEYWRRRTHRLRSGRQLSLVEAEAERMEEIRELQERLDEPGLGERQVDFSYIGFTVYVLLGLVIVGIPLAIVLKKADDTTTFSEPKRDGEAVLPVSETQVTSDSAREVAEAFLNAPSVEDRLELVRHPSETHSWLSEFPEEVRTYPIEYTEIRPMGLASASGEARFHRFGVRMADGKMRFLGVVESNSGPVVDYEAFARYGTASFQDLLEGAAAEEVRVIARRSTYFDGEFTDSDEWDAFELTSPDWPKSFTGYAPDSSVTAKTLNEIVSEASQRVVLKLRPAGESYLKRQIVIEKVLASGWVETEGDIEAKWLRRFGPRLLGDPDALRN